VNQKEKWAVIRTFSKEYLRGKKKQRTELLNRLGYVTGYSRKHLMEILVYPPARKPIRRRRSSCYQVVFPLLEKLWVISNYACGQRLVPMIPVYLESLTCHGEMKVGKRKKALLLRISSATADRLLVSERKRIALKGRSRTKPGTLLKHQIPIRTWADWDNTVPGFLEIDSVHHCGDSPSGEYIHTLDTTDVASGWNECRGHLGRSERETTGALEVIRQRLPFPLRGIDFDTGGEFVNYHLIRYCEEHKITYTRARETIKNDQPYIEQQNYSVVRRFVGYQRLDTREQLVILNQLYEKLSDYQNFFQPVMRLKDKIRDGARVTRRYGQPKTAYQRLLEREDTPEETKSELRERFLTLNPRKLLLEITRSGRKLTKR